MTQASALPAAPAAGRDVARIVLFGMPDAGKSSLLGALVQASRTQEYLLHGRLTDAGGGLAELQRRLYEEQPRETLEEIVPYPVAFEPFAGSGAKVAPSPPSPLPPQGEMGEGTTTPPSPPLRGRGIGGEGERIDAILVDCDGRVANELLARRRALEADGRDNNLAQAILEADTLLFAEDASANSGQVETDFREFDRFLRLLEQSRGHRSDVGGLPVFVVLTKCDLLARPDDTPDAWIERVEERKRQVDARFREFLARQRDQGPVPFGRVDLHLWATAVKHPALVGNPSRPREPFGVAELFRQAFASAAGFRERRARSGRRLLWTAAGSTGVVAALAVVAASLLGHRHQESPAARELAMKVESYRVREAPTPSVRLRGPLQLRIGELNDLANDPGFTALPQEERAYVTSRLRELEEYRTYLDRIQRLPAPDTVRSGRELEELEKNLEALAPPAEHRSDWSQTEAAQLRARRLEEVHALRAAVTEAEEWYNRLARRGQDLWLFSEQKAQGPIPWTDWQAQVQALFEEADAPPRRPTDRLPNSDLTYLTAYRFDRVAAARNVWEPVHQRLQRVRDLSMALGLAGPLPGRSALDIPTTFTADQAAGRLRELETAYPHFREEFTLSDLPEAVVGEIRRAARSRYENCLKAGREVVLRHLQEVGPQGGETPEAWRRLRGWLASPQDLQAWRGLATVLGQLQNPESGDPVAALQEFLGRDHFELVLRRLTLEVPDDLNVRPAGSLTLHLRVGEEARPDIAFESSGDERHDARRRVSTYAFRPTGSGSIVYRPGDTLWADLPVRRADSPDWMLTWARGRSLVYQFERLARPPRLHRRGQENTEGEIAEGVALEVDPAGGVPQVPDLMPVVPAKP